MKSLAYRESGASATAFPGGCLIQLPVNTESRCVFEQSIGCHTMSIAPEPARGRLYWCGLCECRTHPDTHVQCEYDGNWIGEDIRRGVVMAASARWAGSRTRSASTSNSKPHDQDSFGCVLDIKRHPESDGVNVGCQRGCESEESASRGLLSVALLHHRCTARITLNTEKLLVKSSRFKVGVEVRRRLVSTSRG